jgi:hypothetical protein
MANYISRDYFLRVQVSARSQVELSPLTISLLKSLTNQVHITLYYDKKDPVYDLIDNLLRQYELQNPKHIDLVAVDYLLNAGAALKTKEQYELGSLTNMIIFDCAGSAQRIPGSMLADYDYEMLPDKTIRQKFTAFKGETAFTAALLAVMDPKKRHAYFLQGHGEHDVRDGNDEDGYLRFAEVLGLNHVEPHLLDNLAALGGVPTNCDLLIIAGPRSRIPAAELEKIDAYLDRSGSRLLALLAAYPSGVSSGLEGILATNWGVLTSSPRHTILDPEHSPGGSEVVVGAYSIHPVTSPLATYNLELGQPRAVGRYDVKNQPADAPHVQVLVKTEATAHLKDDEVHKAAFPVMVAVEKSLQGVASDRGPTRMLVVGDSLCLANHWISGPTYANRNFAVCAVNWLLDRTPLLQIGPRPVNEYTLLMTQTQLQSTELTLLAGMPGGVLFLGLLVWLRRRR